MHRHYPVWLKKLIIVCLFFNVGPLTYGMVPSIKDGCHHHCQIQMTTDSGSIHHPAADHDCCNGVQGCGHCAQCSLSMMIPTTSTPSVLFNANFVQFAIPIYPIGFVPALHEHPPRG